MKSTLPSPILPEAPARRADRLDAALERQRWQQELERTQADHVGALDIERLAGRLPDSRGEAGRRVRRAIRQDGRYVRLTRPLGQSPRTWEEQTLLPRLRLPLDWLERLSGLRLPEPGRQAPSLMLEAGQPALLLPTVSGPLLLAERRGQLYQYLRPPGDAGLSAAGSWQLLDRLAALQTGPGSSADEQLLGLERLPEVWGQLSSARRQERARRVRGLVLAAALLLLWLLGTVLGHAGLSLLFGPVVIAVLLLAASLDRRSAAWVQHGPALRQAPERGTLAPAFPAPSSLRPAPREQLLSAATRARLAALREVLAQAQTREGPDLGAPVLSGPVLDDLGRLLEDRFSYPHPDRALDSLLEGQISALEGRLRHRLDLEEQRARALAAERLSREPVDPSF